MMTGTSPGELGIYDFRNRTDHSYAGLGARDIVQALPERSSRYAVHRSDELALFCSTQA